MTDVSKETVWSQALSHIEKSLDPGKFRATFSRTKPVSYDDGVFTIAAPNEFDKKWIMGSYYDLTAETISSILGSETELQIIVDEGIIKQQLSSPAPISEEDIQETIFEFEQQKLIPSLTNEGLGVGEVVPEKEIPRAPKQALGFNPKYTFDSFIVGDSNSFAHGASLAVAESPGLKYNPLFIWGDSGLGKTHLLQSIGNYIHQNFPNKRIIYVTAEQFTDAYTVAVKDGTIQAFKDLFRSVDVLLIDDIQFIEGKTGTIEQFFHTFNYLKERGNQVVIAADRAPEEIDMDARITSRFRSGLAVDVLPPSYEVRHAIIQQFLENQRFKFEKEAMSYIAENSSGNIREMEGILTRVIAYSELSRISEVGLDTVKEVVGDLFRNTESKPIPIIEIQKEVARYYSVTQLDIIGTKRRQDIVQARHVAMYLAQELTDKSLPQIGKAFGDKDHTTVLHAVGKIRKNISKDKDLYNTIGLLSSRLKS